MNVVTPSLRDKVPAFGHTPVFSRTWTFLGGDWHEGNVPIMGPRTHGAWMSSVVFDGARAFEGVVPDVALHCARVNHSAEVFALKPLVSIEEWGGLVAEGRKRFEKDATLYIRPMYWAETGPFGGVRHDPESTRWCLTLYEAPMRPPTGISITLSPYRRPSNECAPVEAKAACLYPNNARAIMEAQARGFDNCLMRDLLGNIAELGTANVFIAKDGIVYTPEANGTFLNGITRQRVISLLRGDGVSVIEKTLSYADFLNADEIFATGNYSKVIPVTRIEDRALAPGRFCSRARALYWAFAHDEGARTLTNSPKEIPP
ncbi:MAG TPA: branched-chain amino acid aminotransferase [Micropepsaceae bacterium]|nr:branched-chain amino acid aminotransferase [Micropepsaceae bacterium]